jgi:hypothetical protein
MSSSQGTTHRLNGGLLRRISSPVHSTNSITSRVCPACSGHSREHRFALLASVPVKENDDPQVLILLRAIKNHDWHTVLAFQDWEGGSDNYELYGIRGENHPVVLVTVWDPFELFYNERIVDTEVLDETESNKLLALAGDTWKSASEIA